MYETKAQRLQERLNDLEVRAKKAEYERDKLQTECDRLRGLIERIVERTIIAMEPRP